VTGRAPRVAGDAQLPINPLMAEWLDGPQDQEPPSRPTTAKTPEAEYLRLARLHETARHSYDYPNTDQGRADRERHIMYDAKSTAEGDGFRALVDWAREPLVMALLDLVAIVNGSVDGQPVMPTEMAAIVESEKPS
jgi:hypothetical protein